MNRRQRKISLIFALLIFASLACSLTGDAEIKPEVPPDGPAEDSIATSVAATLAAAASEDTEDDPSAELQPAETQEPIVLPEPNFNYAGVNFYFNNLLAENLTAGVNPGEYNENAPWWSKPEHREYLFNNWVLSDTFLSPTIRIYPVEEYRAINENVSDGLDDLQSSLENKPADGDGLRVLDLYNAGQMYQSNVKYLKFQNGSGARWLSQYGQDSSPIGWPDLFYTFQGITDDGKYYISMILPVNHPSLPHPDQVTRDQAFYDNFLTYAANTRSQLEAESDPSFVPSLVLLDQIVETLSVGSQ
jgi:hypothetical protein